MSELPQGWALTELGQVGDWCSGGTPSRRNAEYFGVGIPWVKSGDLPDGSILRTEEQITELGLTNSAAKLMPAGTISMALYGATIGKLGVMTFPAATNQACANVVPHSELIDPRYLFFYLRSERKALIEKGQGGAQPNISQEIVKSHPAVVAPIKEQRRIVAKLEQLLGRVDAAQERLATIRHILKRFRQSVLAAACSGQLTIDWRQEDLNGSSSAAFLNEVSEERFRLLGQQGKKAPQPVELDINLVSELPEEWSWATIDQLSTKVVDGVHKKPNYVDAGIPFLTVRNLTAGPGISFERTSFISHEDHLGFTKRANPEKGDILVTKDGTLGTVRLIETERVFSIFVSLAMIKPVIRTFGPYLALVLSAPQVQQSIVKTGTGLQHIHLRDLRAVAVPIPPEQEQQEIVRRVKALFNTADALEARYRKAKAYVDKLTPSILAKAFRGELVPQDPTDEPASVLLQRIKAEPSLSSTKPPVVSKRRR